jgi:transcriptional regulator
MEQQLATRPAWTMGKMDGDTLACMMRMILPFWRAILRIETIFKLGQNQTADLRAGAARGGSGTVGAGGHADCRDDAPP